MPDRKDVYYFGAGPAPLPTPVLEEAAQALLNYKDLGYGIAEMSHRSPDANQVLADAQNAMRSLLNVPEDYEIFFLHGGGSGEFSAVVYHMCSVWVERQRQMLEKLWETTGAAAGRERGVSEDEKFHELDKVVKSKLRMDYLVTGSWSLKASQEAARLMGSRHVHIITDARKSNDGKFGVIPPEDSWNLRRPTVMGAGADPQQSAFTYLCDNETVDGVEFPGFPKALEASNGEPDRLVVADMSSNFVSRKVDVSKYAVIFGGAQKNIGTTGITIVLMRKSLLPPHAAVASPDLLRRLGLSVGPVVLDWPTIVKNNSLYNTLPILDVWIAGKVMARSLKIHGSIAGQEQESNTKAQKIYKVLDDNPSVYRVVPDRAVRSRMNICVRVLGGSAEGEDKFLQGAKLRGLLGLKGHRSVGGIRISNYNAVPPEAVDKLVDYLEHFVKEQK